MVHGLKHYAEGNAALEEVDILLGNLFKGICHQIT